MAGGQLLDHTGTPIVRPPDQQAVVAMQDRLNTVLAKLNDMRRQRHNDRHDIRAKFDAAQTFTGNENHWKQADFLDPHAVASYEVRRRLRSRSRYEICENNPYLKGTVLTICNDFVGSGPKLKVVDEKLSPEKRQLIQQRFMEWATAIGLRQKLWRARMAKIVDGETFLIPYVNKNRKIYDPVLLDFQVIEADRVSTFAGQAIVKGNITEIDGVRFDKQENPTEYFVLDRHPGSNYAALEADKHDGKWIKAKYVIHWYRQDRGWLRGIPETTPSLPLCSVLRRYTMSVLRNAEASADITVLLETELPASPGAWTNGQGQQLIDDPFDIFPIEMGMAMTLPFGYKANQLDAVPMGVQYDEYVGSLLREITRPILSPYNITSGSSKDSNMASGVLDATIYKGGQQAERMSCEESALCFLFYLWWQEAIRIPGHLGSGFSAAEWKDKVPKHRYRWDRIGLDHTDPAKVAQALETLHNKRFLTDADIQESYYNRDVDDWREEIEEDDEFRAGLENSGFDAAKPAPGEEDQTPPGGKGKSPPKKPAAKKKPAKTRR